MSPTKIASRWVVLAFVLSTPAPAQESSVRFISLGDLPGGAVSSTAYGISPDGSTVVGSSNSTLGDQAFLWTETLGMRALNPPAGRAFVPVIARAASLGGAFVVGFGAPGGGRAFRWSEATGATMLSLVPGDAFSEAVGLSADGSVVVGSSERQAFRWTPGGGTVGLGFCAGSLRSSASGVSADGAIVVGSCEFAPRSFEAFRWTRSKGMVGLGGLNAELPSTRANAISADGSVVVGTASGVGDSRAFRWTRSGGMTELTAPGEVSCEEGEDVAADGSVILVRCSHHPAIWDAVNGLRDLRGILNSAGIYLTGRGALTASGISDDGRIVAGTLIKSHSSGQSHEGWVAVLSSDSDGDGVDDATDQCPATPRREVAEPETGCSVLQLCPCDGQWKTRGAYLSCVAKVSKRFVRHGLIDHSERRELLKEAVRSRCGLRRHRH